MTSEDYSTILRRVGIALCIFGALDIGYMFYCVFNSISYSSSFNIFAIAAGYFLYNGSLRAAMYIRLVVNFFFPAMMLAPLGILVIQPADLTLTQLRLNPYGSVSSWLIYLAIGAFLFWIAQQLDSPALLETQKEAGLKAQNLAVPRALGILLCAGIVTLVSLFLNSSYGKVAEKTALEKFPHNSDYRACVQSLHVSQTGSNVSISADVTVWNKESISNVEVNTSYHDE